MVFVSIQLFDHVNRAKSLMAKAFVDIHCLLVGAKVLSG